MLVAGRWHTCTDQTPLFSSAGHGADAFDNTWTGGAIGNVRHIITLPPATMSQLNSVYFSDANELQRFLGESKFANCRIVGATGAATQRKGPHLPILSTARPQMGLFG